MVEREEIQSFINALPEPLLVIGKDYRVRLMNTAAMELAGITDYREGESCCFQLTHKRDTPCPEGCPLKAVLRQGKAIKVYHKHFGSDGENRNCEVVAAPLTNCNGEITEVVEIIRAVSEIKQALSNNELISLIESTPDVIITADSNATIISCNNSVERVFGYKPRELLGKPVTILMPAGYREMHEKAFKRAATTKNFKIVGHTVEINAVRKDGTEFPIELSLSTWTSGQQRYFTAIIRDISRRKKIEEALRQKQKELEQKNKALDSLLKKIEIAKKEWESTVDCLADMILITDNKGRIIRCNKAVTAFFNKPFDEILGKKWESLFSENDLLTGTLYGSGTELYHKPSGKWFVVHSYSVTFKDRDAVNYIITFHDTTELKQITEELERKNREIEIKNRELQKAYEELKQTQLQILQQEKMASIGQLAAGVAHEINNPMGFISSNLSTLSKYIERLIEYMNLLSNSTSPDQSEKLEEAKKRLKIDYIIEDIKDLINESLEGAERVKKIVQDLKTFSRVDEAEYKMADINECIESTLNIVWNELKYKATVTKEYGDIPLTKCYPQQLSQVFMNLLVNAAHAIEKQGEIKIKTWADDGWIYITVSDTGCGIPKENLSKIFEPFFTTKEVGKGTGLGLSIAYDIIKKHNGEISVDSEVGKGTTFTIKIPIKAEE